MDYAKAKEYELGGVKVVGTRFLDDRVLLTLSGLTLGAKLKVPGEDVAKAIKQLWKQKLFIQENTLLNRKLIGAKST